MRSHYKLFCIIMFQLFIISSCVSAHDRLNRKFKTFPKINSTLIYEFSSAFSGASGHCKGTFLDRWYGSDVDTEAISKLYKEEFLSEGWQIWPGEAVEIWSLKDNDGLYRVHLDVFSDPTAISQEQGSYRLADSTIQKLVKYQSVYLINLTYMSSADSEACFGK